MSDFIDNPLEWQKPIDQNGMNLHGSSRFWSTIEALTSCRMWTNGAPEFTALVIELREGLGLLLTAEAWEPERDGDEWFTHAEITPRFVELDYAKDYWPVKEDE